ncbi:DNA polymerase III subunit gamma/tau, partial [Patescibacteria group bacterium]|nr:DNA polymerase III subunit gamma/tau [Patescibacteria group bacterium]
MPSLSQEYRPQRFADVTGQEHISDTLRKEIATGKLGHAYLFSGPRGVGKTTSARIFAKALNCLVPEEGEPCTTCALCVAFQENRLVDVIELDAATHTGVDTVRESIIEHARFAPMMGKRKVYILDEAHMLSTASWNALLKTLEEPPAHAFFLLATTEVHKVPATIVSRCQRFEFRRIADAPLAARLSHIATEQKWQVDEDVIRLLVARAEGCARDAETLLGQLGALGETHLTLALASLIIPPSRIPLAAELMGAWSKRDHVTALQTGQRFFDQGVPLVPLMDDLLLVVKRLLFAIADPNTAETWKQGTEEDRCLLPLLSTFSPLELNEMALILMERRRDMKGGVDPLFALQLASTVIAFRGQSVAVAPASVAPIVAPSVT